MGKPDRRACDLPDSLWRRAYFDTFQDWDGLRMVLWPIVSVTTGLLGWWFLGGGGGALVGVGGVLLAYLVVFLFRLCKPRQHWYSYFEPFRDGFVVNLEQAHPHEVAEVHCVLTLPSGGTIEANRDGLHFSHGHPPGDLPLYRQFPRSDHFPDGPPDGSVAESGVYAVRWTGTRKRGGKLRPLAKVERFTVSQRGADVG